MPVIAEQKHHVPGRMRLSLPFAKRDRALLNRIRETLTGMPGVRGIDINAINATMIIHYDPAMYDEFPLRAGELRRSRKSDDHQSREY